MLKTLIFFSFFCMELFSFYPWGKDSALCTRDNNIKKQRSFLEKGAQGFIYIHQNFITHIDGPRSSYFPSSSSYMKQAIERYGFLQGYLMGCDRLLRENKEKWVYMIIEIDGELCKYDPAKMDKLL